jgi:hypothetical protein
MSHHFFYGHNNNEIPFEVIVGWAPQNNAYYLYIHEIGFTDDILQKSMTPLTTITKVPSLKKVLNTMKRQGIKPPPQLINELVNDFWSDRDDISMLHIVADKQYRLIEMNNKVSERAINPLTAKLFSRMRVKSGALSLTQM